KEFALQLVYTTTFNNCQGLILDCAVLEFCVPPFTYRLQYTSLSIAQHRNYIHQVF
ncbi:hypothetical protein HOY80DRAFT_878104, partial [Tuber brumale]